MCVKGLRPCNASAAHQIEEFLEMREGVVGSGSCFRVILDRKNRSRFVTNAFNGAIIEVKVRHLEIVGARHTFAGSRHGKSMIL